LIGVFLSDPRIVAVGVGVREIRLDDVKVVLDLPQVRVEVVVARRPDGPE